MSGEIIKFKGRRFVRTGERRPPRGGDWFWSPAFQEPLMEDEESTSKSEREILRELPAETSASDICCKLCGDSEEAIIHHLDEDDDAGHKFEAPATESGLLAEAEEALADIIRHPGFINCGRNQRDKAEAVLARIRAAKGEKP